MAPNKRGGALTRDPDGGSVLSKEEIADRGTGTQVPHSNISEKLCLLIAPGEIAVNPMEPTALAAVSVHPVDTSLQS